MTINLNLPLTRMLMNRKYYCIYIIWNHSLSLIMIANPAFSDKVLRSTLSLLLDAAPYRGVEHKKKWPAYRL